MKKIILLFGVITAFCLLNNISYAQAPGWLWAKRAGGIIGDYALSVAVDASGNAYVTGYFTSPTITFGSDTLINAGSYDIFLAKYNATGNLIWVKSVGGEGLDVAESIAVDASGNICITGYFDSPHISFGSYLLNTDEGFRNIFIAKYDTNGNVLWAKSAGRTSVAISYSVTSDDLGNIYIAGYFQLDTISFGTNTLTNAGVYDVFLTKYDADGNVLWAKSAGGTDMDVAFSVVVDGFGNIYLTGQYKSPTITIGSDTLINAGEIDVFVAKYDANGNVLWVKSVGGTGADYKPSVAVDASENIYLVGNFESPTISFGSYTLTNAGVGNVFLAKYNANGNVIWVKSFGGISSDIVESVAVDASGNIFMAGYFGSPLISFGSFTLTNSGGYDIFLIKYDANGNMLWAKSAGGTGDDKATSIAVDATGNLFLAGYFNSPTISFGSDTLTNGGDTGLSDVFLAKSATNFTTINELNNSSRISIVPNPASDKITIETLAKTTPSEFSIMNVNGQILISRQISEAKTHLDISTLPSGVYFIRLVSEKGVQTGKVIKQ